MTQRQSVSQAQKLLTEYRNTAWRKSLLEAVPSAKPKALDACEKRINFTQKLVEILRNDKRLGEKLYWVIYQTYLTTWQPGDIEEILENIAEKLGHIPRSSYFRLRGRAIEILDEHLSELSNDRLPACI